MKHKKKIEEKLNRELTNDEAEVIEAQQNGFKKLLDFLIKREVYTWEDYRQQIIFTNEKDRTVWKRLRQKEDTEKLEIIDTNKFVACLFPDEFSKDNFSKSDISNIGRIADLHENFIIMTINNFRFQNGLHGYIRQKHKKGEALPKDQTDLYDMLEEEEPEFTKKNRDKAYNEIKERLGYSDEHVKRNEQHQFFRKLKKTKRTYLY